MFTMIHHFVSITGHVCIDSSNFCYIYICTLHSQLIILLLILKFEFDGTQFLITVTVLFC